MCSCSWFFLTYFIVRCCTVLKMYSSHIVHCVVFGSVQLRISLYWKNLDCLVLKDGLRRNFRSKECKKQEYGEPFHNAQQLLA
jgi:hypothetical protein